MMSKKYIAIAVLFILTIFFSAFIFESFIQKDEVIRREAMAENLIFQTMYNHGDYADMYEKGTPDFQKITDENDFISLMKKKKYILGNFVRFDLISSNVINSNVVITTYRSIYEHYSLIEEFKLIRKNDKEKLRLGTYFMDDGGKRGEVIKL